MWLFLFLSLHLDHWFFVFANGLMNGTRTMHLLLVGEYCKHKKFVTQCNCDTVCWRVVLIHISRTDSAIIMSSISKSFLAVQLLCYANVPIILLNFEVIHVWLNWTRAEECFIKHKVIYKSDSYEFIFKQWSWISICTLLVY